MDTSGSILTWLLEQGIQDEKGRRLSYDDRLFLLDILCDWSREIVIKKSAQIGGSVTFNLKVLYAIKHLKLNVIYCVDTETEALTKRGFKKYNEITLDDELLTLDLNGISKWDNVQEIFIDNVATEMYRYEGRNFNAFVTSNHRWIVQNDKESYKIVLTKNLKKRHLYIPKIATNYQDPIQTYRNDYIQLLAWVFAEGYYCKQKGIEDNSIILSQSIKNKEHCEEIRECLKYNGSKWKEYWNRHNQCFNFRFAFELGRRIKLEFPYKIPTADFALKLTRQQAKLFIDTFVKGDGWVDKNGTQAITQQNKECVDILCMIAIIAGYVPSIIPPDKNNAYTIRLVQLSKVYIGELNPVITQEKDILVWCPRTLTGTFYARRKGQCYWTGNTFPTASDVSEFVVSKTNKLLQSKLFTTLTNAPSLDSFLCTAETFP